MLISFEGAEGAGKTTQARLLADWLRAQGREVVLTREPGGTRLGERLRDVLLHRDEVAIGDRAELLLFCAARAQLVHEVISPALARGAVVISDRFGDSTLAYQGYGRGLPLAPLREVVAFATGGLTPDRTILLDLDVTVGLARQRGLTKDRFSREDLAFHERVRAGFRELAAAEPARWLVLDAALPPATLAAQIVEVIQSNMAAEQQSTRR